MKNKSSLWFAAFDENYAGETPAFIPSDELAFVHEIESNFNIIMQEAAPLLNSDEKYMPYFEENKQYPPESWKTIPLTTLGIQHKSAIYFPETTKLLNKIPGYLGAFISKMDRNSRIVGHCGPTNAFYRCHLGLKIPSGNISQCGISVNHEESVWTEGKIITFVDGNFHHTWNNTDEERYVLIFDVLKPSFINKKKYICTRLIISYLFLKIYETSKSGRFKVFISDTNYKPAINFISHILSLFYPAVKLLKFK